jgi:hypothetical protein
VLIAAALMRRQNPLAFLTAIFAVTAVAWGFGYATPPERIVSALIFSSVFLKLDILGALRLGAPARNDHDPRHRSLRLAVDVHGRRERARLVERDGTPLNLRRGSSWTRARPSAQGWSARRRERRMSRASPAFAWAPGRDAPRS